MLVVLYFKFFANLDVFQDIQSSKVSFYPCHILEDIRVDTILLCSRTSIAKWDNTTDNVLLFTVLTCKRTSRITLKINQSTFIDCTRRWGVSEIFYCIQENYFVPKLVLQKSFSLTRNFSKIFREQFADSCEIFF